MGGRKKKRTALSWMSANVRHYSRFLLSRYRKNSWRIGSHSSDVQNTRVLGSVHYAITSINCYQSLQISMLYLYELLYQWNVCEIYDD